MDVVDIQRSPGRQYHVRVTSNEFVGRTVGRIRIVELPNPLGVADKVIGHQQAILPHDRAALKVGNHLQSGRLVGPVTVDIEEEPEVVGPGEILRSPAKRIGVHEHRRPRQMLQLGQVHQQVVLVQRSAVRVNITHVCGRQVSGQVTNAVDVVGGNRQAVSQRVLRGHHPADHLGERLRRGGLGHQLGSCLIGDHRDRGPLATADREKHHRHRSHHPQHDEGDDQCRAAFCPEKLHRVCLIGTRWRNSVTLLIFCPRKFA